MRTTSYFLTVLATAIALANAAPSSSTSSSSSRSSSSSSSSGSSSRAATSTSSSSSSQVVVTSATTTTVHATVTTEVDPPINVAATSIDSKYIATQNARPSNPKNGSRKSAGKSTSTSSSSSTSPSTSTTSSSAPAATQKDTGAEIGDFYVGANSYYLFALQDADRIAVLDAMSGAGMKVVRIFLTHVMENNKGSGNDEVPDLEQWAVGQYDDTILGLVDQLMVETVDRGMKLIIALGDRYALGFWDTDQYAYKYGIVDGGSGAQKVSDASVFYTSDDAMTNYDHRIDHIMTHRNPLMGNKTWAELENAVYAFEPQNEPQGHMSLASSSWNCDRAGRIKNHLPSDSGIKISTGGGITTATSLADWAWECDNFDIISVHDYGTSASVTVGALVAAKAKASDRGKEIIFEEWGALGWNKADIIKSFATGLAQAGIPWLYWEVVKPGKGSSDFEVWTDEDSWGVLGDGWSTGTYWKRKRGVSASQSDHEWMAVRNAIEAGPSGSPPSQSSDRFAKVTKRAAGSGAGAGAAARHVQKQALGRRQIRRSSH